MTRQRWTILLDGQPIAPEHPLDATATMQMFEAYVRQYPDATVAVEPVPGPADTEAVLS